MNQGIIGVRSPVKIERFTAIGHGCNSKVGRTLGCGTTARTGIDFEAIYGVGKNRRAATEADIVGKFGRFLISKRYIIGQRKSSTNEILAQWASQWAGADIQEDWLDTGESCEANPLENR